MGLLTDRINSKLEKSNLINEHALNRQPVPLSPPSLISPPPLLQGKKINPPTLLSPLPLPLVILHFTLLISHDCKTSRGLIQDGLFTNWQFGSLTDPWLHDLQLLVLVVCPLCILVLLGQLRPWSLLNKIRPPSQICPRLYLALKLPPPPLSTGGGGLNRGFRYLTKNFCKIKI